MKTIIALFACVLATSVMAQPTPGPTPGPGPTPAPAVPVIPAPVGPTELKCTSMVAHDFRGKAVTYEACNWHGKVTSCQDVQYVDRKGNLRRIENCSLVDAPK
jgi:hypothetical protein